MRARKPSPAAAVAKAPGHARRYRGGARAADRRHRRYRLRLEPHAFEILGCKVWLKFENLQFTASFKERGALNRLRRSTPDERKRGVIAMSAGNHAQGVAYHAHRLGIPATIVMPVNTPTVKVVNTRRHGAEVILTGETVEEAAAFAQAHGRERGLTFIHPYDDPLVIAGQGTIALEMLGAAPEIDTLVVPIGGGGLISGMAVAAKALKPGIRLIGVQAALYPSMYNAIKGSPADARRHAGRGHRRQGAGPHHAGDRAPAGRRHRAGLRAGDRARGEPADQHREDGGGGRRRGRSGCGAEGAGAVQGRTVGLVLCGGNIDTRLLASVLSRELAREGRLTQLTIDLVDRPGQLAKVANLLGEAGANIVEVYHQRVFSDLPAKGALLEVVIETRDRAHLEETVARLKAAGFEVDVRSNPGGTR